MWRCWFDFERKIFSSQGTKQRSYERYRTRPFASEGASQVERLYDFSLFLFFLRWQAVSYAASRLFAGLCLYRRLHALEASTFALISPAGLCVIAGWR